MFKGRTPDITAAQLVAAVGWIVAQLVAYGYLDIRYQQLAVSIGSTALAVAWHFADSHLRAARAKAHVPPRPDQTPPGPPVAT